MKEIGQVAKKELFRFFTDKRMVLSTILLPGIMIYLLYSVMGGAFGSMSGGEEAAPWEVAAVNLPDAIGALAGEVSTPGAGLRFLPAESPEEMEALLSAGTVSLGMLFREDFDEAVADYRAEQGGTAPEVRIYYDEAREDSVESSRQMTMLLADYESGLTNKFDIRQENIGGEAAAGGGIAGMLLSSMLPFLLIVFLFSACMAIVPESIAGEKERGTIATLLVTPMKRSHLALGKILAMGGIALCSGISSFLGTFLSLPKLIGLSGEEGISLARYGFLDYLLLLLLIFSTLLLLVSLISMISAFARSVKEASTAAMPLMMVVMLVGMTGMFGGTVPESLWMYLIPIYNAVQSMTGIFAGNLSVLHTIVAILSNLVYSSLGVYFVTRLFGSERAMFGK